MEFRPAKQEELNQIHSLYQSVIGTKYCVWDEDYPSFSHVQEDFQHNNLFVMSESGSLVGAISIVTDNELDELNFWINTKACEIARVIVSPEYQGLGIAGQMVMEVSHIVKERSFPSIHLLASKDNPPAQKVYEKCGFQLRGHCFMFGHSYFAYERLL